MEKFYFQENCYVRTDDDSEDWCPTYKIDGKDYLRLHIGIATPMNLALVGVWGNDDFGMNKSFPVENYKQAIDLYNKIKSLDIINKNLLVNMGFRDAMDV